MNEEIKTLEGIEATISQLKKGEELDKALAKSLQFISECQSVDELKVWALTMLDNFRKAQGNFVNTAEAIQTVLKSNEKLRAAAEGALDTAKARAAEVNCLLKTCEAYKERAEAAENKLLSLMTEGQIGMPNLDGTVTSSKLDN